MLYPVQKSWLESLLRDKGASFSARVAAAMKQQVLHEVIPQRQFSSMAAFYQMLLTSGQLQMLTVMPSEIIID